MHRLMAVWGPVVGVALLAGSCTATVHDVAPPPPTASATHVGAPAPYRGSIRVTSVPLGTPASPLPSGSGLIVFIVIESCRGGPGHCSPGPSQGFVRGTLDIRRNGFSRTVVLPQGERTIVRLAPAVYSISARRVPGLYGDGSSICPTGRVAVPPARFIEVQITCEY
jgi:hypothetical protein